ncbi:MAG TPA: nuclear transport factor 2 family protein [Quisquiliibacterium sp.]|nr:nuclear transport factor 2 family protein [Quisquiliibacterium sp.]
MPPTPPRADAASERPAAPGAPLSAGGPSPATAQALARATAFFETLSPASLRDIGALYAPDARFRDPFNDLRGTEAITAVFAHMFEQLDSPRFVVLEAFGAGEQAFVVWDFSFSFRRGSPKGVQTIHGSTHFRFDASGRISLHRDYWDAAEELYSKLPLIGPVMRWLQRRLAVKPAGR